MGAITAQIIYDRFKETLHDVGAVRWKTSEFLDLLSAAQVEIVRVRPDANAVTTVVALVAGTRQTLPAGSIVLIDVTRNLGASGAAPGMVIQFVGLSALNQALPDWHTHRPNAVVKRCAYDPRNPSVFWAYPPQPVGTAQKIEVVRSAIPATLSAMNNTIGIGDEYQGVLLDLALYRALGKDLENAIAIQRSEHHRRAYRDALGVDPAESRPSPQQANEGGG